MVIEQNIWIEGTGWKLIPEMGSEVDLVLVFGSTHRLKAKKQFQELRSFYPCAELVLCSTAGEILEDRVFDDVVTLTAIKFEKTIIKARQVDLADFDDDVQVGRGLAAFFPTQGLKHVLILSHGLDVNATSLIAGMKEILGTQASLSGGLAGDGAAFEQTLVGLNQVPAERKAVAIGLYGESISVGTGSMGGWDTFGHSRIVTKAEANVLYELDGKPALDLYQTYLGEKAKELPGSGLLFPLSIKPDEPGSKEVVRTILGIDTKERSLTFAGDIPEGSSARLMKANFERLYDGASQAAENSIANLPREAELAILISCVGRKLILKSRTEDEVESVREVIGDGAKMTGFYSYGELGPDFEGGSCLLHNQTMTITLLVE